MEICFKLENINVNLCFQMTNFEFFSKIYIVKLLDLALALTTGPWPGQPGHQPGQT